VAIKLKVSTVLLKLACASVALTAAHAFAADGCKVLLCLAGNWSSIAQCRPDVEEAIRDVARGRGWPSCSMAGAGNAANLAWSDESVCPAFYSIYDADTGAWKSCAYAAVIHVSVNGAHWLDLYWQPGSATTSTRYFAPARAALAALDPRYDLDAASWVPPLVAPPTPP